MYSVGDWRLVQSEIISQWVRQLLPLVIANFDLMLERWLYEDFSHFSHCEVDIDKQSGLIPLFNGTDVNVPVATVSGTYDECGAVDVTKGLYVKIDDPTFLSYIKSVSEKVALIPGEQLQVIVALLVRCTNGNAEYS